MANAKETGSFAPEPNPRRGYFDERADTWDSRVKDYTATPFFEEWLGALPLRPGMAILEIGCGTGRVLPPLARAAGPATRIVGLDLSMRMLERARDRLPGPSTSLVQSEACALPVRSARIDLVCICGTFPHLQPYGPVLDECRRVLVAQGELHIVHFAGRETINDIHRGGGAAVASDLLEPADEFASRLNAHGLTVTRCEESDTHYWVAARKARPD